MIKQQTWTNPKIDKFLKLDHDRYPVAVNDEVVSSKVDAYANDAEDTSLHSQRITIISHKQED